MARQNFTFCIEARNILDYSYLLRIYLVKNVSELLQMLLKLHFVGRWWNLVDTLVLGTSGATLESSSLLRPTTTEEIQQYFPFTFFKNKVSAILLIGRIVDLDS